MHDLLEDVEDVGVSALEDAMAPTLLGRLATRTLVPMHLVPFVSTSNLGTYSLRCPILNLQFGRPPRPGRKCRH